MRHDDYRFFSCFVVLVIIVGIARFMRQSSKRYACDFCGKQDGKLLSNRGVICDNCKANLEKLK